LAAGDSPWGRLTRAGWATPSPAGGEAADPGCSDESGFTGVMGGITGASTRRSGGGGSVAPPGTDDIGSEITC
jgi:hypothetical protein